MLPGERDSSILLAKSIPKFWHAKLLKKNDETIDVTMDSYHDIDMRNELHVDGVWYVHHHGCGVGILTHRIACWSTTSFYSTHLQVRFTVVSENRSDAISMWFKSNTHIQPTPLLCPRCHGRCPKLHQHGRHLSFYRIHNVQGYMYLWSENVDALVGGTIWMVTAMSTTWTAALLLLLYWRDLLAYLDT